jgi:hypothetical protein
LLLLAAAHESGLLAALTAALPRPTTPLRLAKMLTATVRALLLTLLFLTAVSLRRTWDLRSYTGTMLALLSGRLWAYGYRHTERFLTELAHAGGAEPLTDALAQWTARLWLPPPTDSDVPLITVSIDGHRKPVYTDDRIPRGLIGRSGAIAGCRVLVLLHDASGHPLLITTARGDTHLTASLPQILARYEQVIGRRLVSRIIVDREGMSAAFLSDLATDGRIVITLLRSDQYSGLSCFTDVGDFVPLCYDSDGTVVREVAPARFALSHPDRTVAPLKMSVALVRDLRCQVAVAPDDDAEPVRWDADLRREERDWHSPDWVATPAPAPPTTAKLIPIVATVDLSDAATMARIYFQRWPRQENIIRDFLIPLGIDTNHGYAKTEVINSEVAKRRDALEQRLTTLKRWAEQAGERCSRAGRRHQRLYTQAKARVRELDRELCQRQRALLRALEDLAAREQQMYELDNAKDQVMTVCEVALANLVMWTREMYFPPSYAHATWKRLEPFFKLPGQIVGDRDAVRVTLRPFNDRQLNRDLAVLCERVEAAAPQLPDGRRLLFTIGATHRLNLDVSPP